MAWNEIIGQKKVKNLLQRAIIENKIANSYCFIGIDGVGKEAVAIEFARTVNCENPIVEADTINACGKCSSCRMTNTLQHPNIKLIYALPSIKAGDKQSGTIADKLTDEQIHDIQEQNALKAADIYHRISIPKATQIRIATVREIKRDLSLTANALGRRMIIVIRADEMTTGAANAFLKTLEEPQTDVSIIIITSKPEAILPTILSRCQQVHFQTLLEDELSSYLTDKFKIDPAEASLAASFGQGSYTKATEFLDEDMKQQRDDVIDYLRTSLKARAYRVELLHKLDNIIKQKDKNKVELILLILLIWLRDALSINKTGSVDLIINKDKIETLQSFTKNFMEKDFEQAINIVENAIDLNRKNVNQQLLLINMFINIRNVFRN